MEKKVRAFDPEIGGYSKEVSQWTRYLYVTVEGNRPQIAGWSFVATIDHADGMNVIRSVPGVGNIPIAYRNALAVCDKCNTIRHRNETFVIRNADGNHKQIGRNCLQDFFPGSSPEDVAQLLTWWTEAVEMASQAGDEEGGYGGGGETRFGLEGIVTSAAKAIDMFGWMSRGKARESFTPVTATADWVAAGYDRPRATDSDDLKNFRAAKATEAQKAEALDAIEWARQIDPDTESDYLYNLLAVCKGETIRRKTMGLVVSLIAAYRREMGRIEEAKQVADRPQSNHIGTIGERDVFKVMTLEHIGNPIENQWGVSTLLKFRDEAGNVVKWFASDAINGYDREWIVGTSYDLVFTPKKHDEFRGSKETLATRVSKWNGKWSRPKAKVAK